ncbi:Ephrin type-A receptor 7 [Liparis tanakae]|uniref:Ephrin type-A receptor 7 n=1 Tax=Liparis tanakae TaxID=230148 RepID=A0A4Z2HUD8_9TELE|nr:Ephrin type-A receptor 7 [Liparis tanakae]
MRSRRRRVVAGMTAERGPPSAPQNLVYNINQTTVGLEWSPPADTGGRNDVTYRVICRRCSWEPEECVPCGPNVGYSPAQSGLADTYLSIVDLLAHANYTFEVEAVNGVSDMSRTQRLFAAVSIATGQAVVTLRIFPVFACRRTLEVYERVSISTPLRIAVEKKGTAIGLEIGYGKGYRTRGLSELLGGLGEDTSTSAAAFISRDI